MLMDTLKFLTLQQRSSHVTDAPGVAESAPADCVNVVTGWYVSLQDKSAVGSKPSVFSAKKGVTHVSRELISMSTVIIVMHAELCSEPQLETKKRAMKTPFG